MTQTSTIHLTQPTVGGDAGQWGGYLNTDLTLIDRAVNGLLTVTVPDANVTLVADGTTSDQSIYAVIQFNGALTADRTITLPANYRIGKVANITTGGHNLIFTSGAGSTLTVKNDAIWVNYLSDGSSVTSPLQSWGAYTRANPGTFKASGGWVIKVGTPTVSVAASSASVSFVDSFGTSCLGVVVTQTSATSGTGATDVGATVTAFTTSGFTLHFATTAAANTASFSYIAFGI